MTPAEDWARCRHWIEEAVENFYGTHTIEDVERGLAAGDYQFWHGERCAAITEINAFPQFTAITVLFVGGDLEELLSVLQPRVFAWAKEAHGAVWVIQLGQRAWTRILKDHGFRPLFAGFMKEI